ncbi:MAG: ABC transporter ATP-binding protein [Ilumatobacteraceae bacterium]
MFTAIQRQSLAFFERTQAGVLVSRMTADIESMGELVQWGLMQFLSAALLVVLSIMLMFLLSWQLALVAIVVLPIVLIATVKFQRDSNAAYLDVRERVGENLSTLQEGITGIRVIQAYAREDEQSRRFRESSRSLFRSHERSLRVSTWYFGLVEFSGILAAAMTVGIGGWLVHRGAVTLGTLVAMILLLANLFEPVQQLSQLYNTVQSAAAALHKLFGILDAEPDVVEPAAPAPLPARGAVDVDHVTFAYAEGGRLAVDDIDLHIGDGERLALVGPTGAGKSTVAKLVARFYDPASGAVRFGGVDLREAAMADIRDRMVVVPQEGFLFGGTILDNIRIARADASDDEVAAALDAIGALARFEAFEEGLRTEVRERGSRLSAGERQLVALARAALVDPAVLVLDEATSNLDPGTELVVEGALERLMRGRTVVVVAHRLSTVRRADRIAGHRPRPPRGARHPRRAHRGRRCLRRPRRRLGPHPRRLHLARPVARCACQIPVSIGVSGAPSRSRSNSSAGSVRGANRMVGGTAASSSIVHQRSACRRSALSSSQLSIGAGSNGAVRTR